MVVSPPNCATTKERWESVCSVTRLRDDGTGAVVDTLLYTEGGTNRLAAKTASAIIMVENSMVLRVVHMDVASACDSGAICASGTWERVLPCQSFSTFCAMARRAWRVSSAAARPSVGRKSRMRERMEAASLESGAMEVMTGEEERVSMVLDRVDVGCEFGWLIHSETRNMKTYGDVQVMRRSGGGRRGEGRKKSP